MRAAARMAAALAAAALLAGAGRATAAIYAYTDEDGVQHFSNVPNDPRFQKVPGSAPPPPKRAGSATGGPYAEQIERAAASHGVDGDLVKAVIKAESDFDPSAVSRAGAQGLMQLMPETARRRNVENPFDPSDNIEGGVLHLKELLSEFGDTRLALAAYNAGENAVRRHNGVPPYSETRNYVSTVLEHYGRYAAGAEGAAAPPPPEPPVQTFVHRDGVTVFTNMPWRYLDSAEWHRPQGE